MTLNPLANPKGVKLVCELCQKPAFNQCTSCKVTYYCGVEHQKSDWLGIHEKICQLLIPLRAPSQFINSEEERVKRNKEILQKQVDIIDLTLATGQRLSFEREYDRAIPAAMQSLRFSIDVHGLSGIELVPSYLILGEASIGLGRLPQAEEYLSQAQWTVLKTPECSNAIKSKLFRNLGLLYAAKGEDEEALRALADDIYHSSLDAGTDDIRTSGGYFHMANIFYQAGKTDVADSLFKRVTDIWYNYLEKIVKSRIKAPIVPKGVGVVVTEINQKPQVGLDEAQEAEAKQVINSVYNVRVNQDSVNATTMAKATHALTMLHFVLKETNKAKESSQRIQEHGLLNSCQDNNVAESIKELDNFLNRQVSTAR